MKLYATVESERCSKGQGGNKHLDIALLVGSASNSLHFASVRLNIPEDTGNYTLWLDGKIVKEWTKEFKEVTKGKKQKDETCKDCGENLYGMVRVHHHTEDGKDVTA